MQGPPPALPEAVVAGAEADVLGQAVVLVNGVVGIRGSAVGCGSPVPQATGKRRPAEQATILIEREKVVGAMAFLRCE
ncbi:hypothetical protein PV458_25530 [Streptomyces sp. MN03-5084-2B]|nr:hypothetical protein [Streptomyces sp. MN03-5084-2B]